MRITGVVKRLSRLTVIGGISTALVVPAAAETFTTIEYPGAMHTRLFGIDPRGTIAGFYINPDGSFHGLLRFGEELTSFDFPGATFTVAIGINPAGAVVGFYGTSPGVFHGYLLGRGQFTTIDVPGAVSSRALDAVPLDAPASEIDDPLGSKCERGLPRRNHILGVHVDGDGPS
jgi:hypothetical protein